MLPQNKPDRIRIVFDDHRLVANAGLLLPATLARHLGLRELVDHHLDLGGAPGRANTGDKMLTLVASALAGGDCIDDADALRAGGTVGVLGCVVKAPSTLGTFLRSFRWGHAPLPRPGAAPTPFPHIILPLPPEDEGFLRGNQTCVIYPPRRVHCNSRCRGDQSPTVGSSGSGQDTPGSSPGPTVCRRPAIMSG